MTSICFNPPFICPSNTKLTKRVQPWDTAAGHILAGSAPEVPGPRFSRRGSWDRFGYGKWPSYSGFAILKW